GSHAATASHAWVVRCPPLSQTASDAPVHEADPGVLQLGAPPVPPSAAVPVVVVVPPVPVPVEEAVVDMEAVVVLVSVDPPVPPSAVLLDPGAIPRMLLQPPRARARPPQVARRRDDDRGRRIIAIGYGPDPLVSRSAAPCQRVTAPPCRGPRTPGRSSRRTAAPR